jgi:hypothetical protein
VKPGQAWRIEFDARALEHVPEKWVYFSGEDMLKLIEVARILVTRMILSGWNTR